MALPSRRTPMRASIRSHGCPWLVLPLPDAAAGPGEDSQLTEFERVLPPYLIQPLTDSR